MRRINKSIKSNFTEKIILKAHGVALMVFFYTASRVVRIYFLCIGIYTIWMWIWIGWFGTTCTYYICIYLYRYILYNFIWSMVFTVFVLLFIIKHCCSNIIWNIMKYINANKFIYSVIHELLRILNDDYLANFHYFPEGSARFLGGP